MRGPCGPRAADEKIDGRRGPCVPRLCGWRTWAPQPTAASGRGPLAHGCTPAMPSIGVPSRACTGARAYVRIHALAHVDLQARASPADRGQTCAHGPRLRGRQTWAPRPAAVRINGRRGPAAHSCKEPWQTWARGPWLRWWQMWACGPRL